MPYKTMSGTHYHDTYGCCGATEPCGTEELAPCRICCGNGQADGRVQDRSNAGEAAGSGVTCEVRGTGLFEHPSGTWDVNGMGAESDSESQGRRSADAGAARHDLTGDRVMQLADSLLAIKASMDATRDGQYAPDSDEVSVTPGSLRQVLDSLPHATVSSVPMRECDISPDDLVGEPITPREAFERQRHEEFLDDFRHQVTELIRQWNDTGWQEWRATQEGLAQYMKDNLHRERSPELSLFIDEEVESLLRRRYEEEVPCPDWHLASMWQRHGRLLTGREERWPGYDEARRRWDAESERLWSQRHGKEEATEPPQRDRITAVA